MLLFIQSIVCLTFAHTYTDNHRAYVIAKQTFKSQCLYNRHSTPADYDNRDCVLHPQNSAQNPLIVRADICGFSARSSAEKVKFSVSCTV